MARKTTVLALSAVLAAVAFAYSNHFENSFHFDDSHAVVNNPHIRDLRNVPRFFADASTFSVLPANRSYRPLVTASLAVDYALAKGLTPLFFHVSTFVWFVVQLLCMYVLFTKICERAHPDSGNRWPVLMSVALFGLHPAIAETVNYVIQRGDVYSTAGVVAGLAAYASFPASRRFGVYLIPVALALLSKQTALIFPAILFVYVRLFEETRFARALERCVPALVVSAAFGGLVLAMTPATFTSGAGSAYAYRITQPLVALGYFRSFFLPNRLSADTDRVPLTSIQEPGVWLGIAFVVAVVGAAVWCSNRTAWRPAAFGLWWFLLALLPTGVFPLAEVENDHRMYFPFVGLVLAVCWPPALWLCSRASLGRPLKATVVVLSAVILLACAWGTRQRNEVWRTEESLWYDVTVKSPRNGRGLMNYGLTQMEKGEFRRALEYFERAAAYTPNYSTLETNLGIVNGALAQDTAAERHFQRAIALAPGTAQSHYYYARWLNGKRRYKEAIQHLDQAVAANADYLLALHLLMEIHARQIDWPRLRTLTERTLERFPSDATAAAYRSRAESALQPVTPEDYLNLSLTYHNAGRFQECIAAAREALRLRPNYAEAYNNISAAYLGLQTWDPAIEAAREALKIRPDFQLARNNLAWAEQQKRATSSPSGGQRAP